MQVTLNGATIKTEADLHAALSESLEFGPHYGNNLAALWDRLTTDVERPIEIAWTDSAHSRIALGEDLFDRIVELMNDVKEQDISFGWADQFSFVLE